MLNLAPLVREISWSNNVVIMEKCKDDLQKEFYIQMVKRYGWPKKMNILLILRNCCRNIQSMSWKCSW